MFRRMICLMLSAAIALGCTGIALAEPADDAYVSDFVTYPSPAAPTATPEATLNPTTAPTATAVPAETPAPTATAAPDETPVPTPPAPTETPAPTPVPTAEPLKVGSRGDRVRELQNYLTLMGFSYESADGIYGSRTSDAVNALQVYATLLNAKGTISYTASNYGTADSQLLAIIESGSIPAYYSDVKKDSSAAQVRRVQNRLAVLEYMLSNVVDGVYGVATSAAISDFQKTSGLPETGVADKATQELLFSASAKKCPDPNARYPYKLIVDVSEQRVYVYEYANGSYSKLKARFLCSTGKRETPTPLGTYRSTEQINAWHYFRDYNCWAQYAYRISGAYYFHSVLYKVKGGTPTASSVRNLGRRASHGCVRLSVENAKWIYNNCPKGTIVVVRE